MDLRRLNTWAPLEFPKLALPCHPTLDPYYFNLSVSRQVKSTLNQTKTTVNQYVNFVHRNIKVDVAIFQSQTSHIVSQIHYKNLQKIQRSSAKFQFSTLPLITRIIWNIVKLKRKLWMLKLQSTIQPSKITLITYVGTFVQEQNTPVN